MKKNYINAPIKKAKCNTEKNPKSNTVQCDTK